MQIKSTRKWNNVPLNYDRREFSYEMQHRSSDKLAMEDIKRVDANAFGNDEYSEISTLPTTKRLFIYATCMQVNIPDKKIVQKENIREPLKRKLSE